MVLSGATRQYFRAFIVTPSWSMHSTLPRTLVGTLPRRANKRGGTSHSDPIPTSVQALRPNVLSRSLPGAGERGIYEHLTQRHMVAPAAWAHTLSSTLSLSFPRAVFLRSNILFPLSPRLQSSARHGFRLPISA